MDYLAIQATSVPCEWVFSLAKATDTAKWNRISPMLIEALQTLKFILKKQRLDFIKGWVTPEAAIRGELKSDVDLGALLKDDANATIDKILKEFCTYDWEQMSCFFLWFQQSIIQYVYQLCIVVCYIRLYPTCDLFGTVRIHVRWLKSTHWYWSIDLTQPCQAAVLPLHSQWPACPFRDLPGNNLLPND